MLGAFANLAVGNFFTLEGNLTFGSAPSIATVVGCVCMMILSKLARDKKIQWLKEWAFAIAMFTGMLLGYIVK